VYQFQTKFRNELRAKSGIMRVREFVMKDLYSFSRTEKEFKDFYEKCAKAYVKVFARAGIGDKTYRTFASGGSFSKFSDEFQMVSEAGEDTIYVHKKKKIAVNKEVYNDKILAELGIEKSELKEEKAIEVGNIFPLGTRFSDALGLSFTDEEGAKNPVIMGCYGIGPGRLMGAIAEANSDEKGLVWSEEVAPFRAHLVSIAAGNKDIEEEADRYYDMLRDEGIEVLYDDRDVRAGEKFADAELIGIPTRLVVSEKTVSAGGIEVSARAGAKKNGATLVRESEIVEFLKGKKSK
jgi:prolyl-tRNA synthetase